jgi:ribosomal protein L7Ae-like RNA K-turn-binding protein
MRKKIETYLGFAKKSGNLLAGYNTCVSAMNKGKIKLLIICEDVAENSMEKITSLAKAKHTKYRIYGHSDVLGLATGSPGRAIFGITDAGFAKTIADEIELEETKTLKEKEVQ